MAFGEDLDELVEKTGGLLGKFETWERVRLSDIANVVNGYAFKSKHFSKDTGEPLIRIRDVISGETGTLYDGPRIDGYDVRAGDLLIGMDGDFNSARWQGRNALLNQRVCRIDFKSENYHPRLLSYALPGFLNKINEHTSAVTVKHLSSRTIQNIPLPLPPLAEQSRIVDKIDELFSSIEAGERAIARARTALTRYRKAVLKAAVTGELTADWREQNPPTETAETLLKRILKARYAAWEKAELEKLDAKGKAHPKTDKEWVKFRARYKAPVEQDTDGLPQLPAGWVWTSLPQMGEFGRGKSKHRPRNDPSLFDGEFPFLQTGRVRGSNGRIREYDKTYNAKGLAQSRMWPKGTVCITIAANIAETGILDFDACFPDSVVGLIPHPDLGPEYPEFFLRTARDNLDRYAPGSAQKNINLGILEKVAVPFPSKDEQAEIVSRVEEALSKADKVEATLDAQARQAKALKQAVLKTAFEGKLVPQNPNDEPASELLKRIKAAS